MYAARGARLFLAHQDGCLGDGELRDFEELVGRFLCFENISVDYSVSRNELLLADLDFGHEGDYYHCVLQ